MTAVAPDRVNISVAMLADLLKVSEAAVLAMLTIGRPVPHPAPRPEPAAPVGPPGPPPSVSDRAYVADISQVYQIPASTLYNMLDDGTLPCWRLGCRKRCSSWPAVRAFFEGEAAG